MSNFGTLFYYELKKVLSQKAYWCALVIMGLIVFANELTPLILGNYPSNMERQRTLDGITINDEFLSEIKNSEDSHMYDPLDFFIKAATGQTDFSEVTETSLYETRAMINERLMDENKLSAKEKSYWFRVDQKNQTPYTYHYDLAYMDMIEMAGYLNFMVLILCAVGLSGIFADEKHKGTDQLLFCTRNGKTTLYAVKIIVGALIGALSATVINIINIGVCIGFNGPEGFSNMIQLHIPTCMMHITVGEACIYMALLLTASGIFMGMIAEVISLMTMNHPVTIGVMVFLMFASMFNLPSGLGWIATLWATLPGTFVGSWLFEEYHVIVLGENGLSLMQCAPIIWLMVGAGLIAVGFLRYRRYQVKAR